VVEGLREAQRDPVVVVAGVDHAQEAPAVDDVERGGVHLRGAVVVGHLGGQASPSWALARRREGGEGARAGEVVGGGADAAAGQGLAKEVLRAHEGEHGGATSRSSFQWSGRPVAAESTARAAASRAVRAVGRRARPSRRACASPVRFFTNSRLNANTTDSRAMAAASAARAGLHAEEPFARNALDAPGPGDHGRRRPPRGDMPAALRRGSAVKASHCGVAGTRTRGEGLEGRVSRASAAGSRRSA
jgi:hypothetical protein